MPQICTLNVLVKYVFMFLFYFMSNLKLDVFVYEVVSVGTPVLNLVFSDTLPVIICFHDYVSWFLPSSSGFTAVIVNSHWPLDLPCMDPVL